MVFKPFFALRRLREGEGVRGRLRGGERLADASGAFVDEHGVHLHQGGSRDDLLVSVLSRSNAPHADDGDLLQGGSAEDA
jgi:hypothetical protein